MNSEKDYYKILHLPKSASLAQIKDSYKKLALKHHPDKNPQNPVESKKIFQKVSEAYTVLSDVEKRKKYDKYGNVEDFDFDYDQFMKEFDFSDMFDLMFMGMKHMFGPTRHSKHKNMRHLNFDFEKQMHDFKKKKDKMKSDEKNYKGKEGDWETDEENDDEYEDIEEVVAKKSDQEMELVFLPMFVAENSIEIKKLKGYKCKFDGIVLKEKDLFSHFEKEHKKELAEFMEENEDLNDIDMGFGGFDEMEMLSEMMNPMFFLGGGNKKKKKKAFK